MNLPKLAPGQRHALPRPHASADALLLSQLAQREREAGRLRRPAPLFEHARFLKFMREVFETIAYAKTTDQAAAQRLVREGNALLHRL